MKLLPFIAAVVALLPLVTFAQAQIGLQNRKDLQVSIQSEKTLTALGVEKVIDPHDHNHLFGRTVVFDDGLTVQITYDSKGADPGYHICWRSALEGKPYDNYLRVSSNGKIDESVINGVTFDPKNPYVLPAVQPTPPQTTETIPVLASGKPPEATLVKTEEPILTSGQVAAEYNRLRTEILTRLSKQAPPKEEASEPNAKPIEKEAKKKTQPKASSKKPKKK